MATPSTLTRSPRRQAVIDIGLAVAVGLLGYSSWENLTLDATTGISLALIMAVSTTALIWRSRQPMWALTIMAAAMIAQILLVGEFTFQAGLICAIAAYTSQAELLSPGRWAFAAVLLGGLAWAVATAGPQSLNAGWGLRIQIIVMGWVVLVLFGLLGERRRRNRERVEAALERSALVFAQQETEQRLAVLDERNRIAREMHDVLAHSLSVVAVQAEGARLLLDSDPERVRIALGDIGRLSRQAMTEVGELLDVLRSDPDAPERSHRIGELPELLDDFRSAGLTIEPQVDGDLAAVPAQVSAVAYRIVTEALTNVLRHAGQAQVELRLTVRPGELALWVGNNPGPLPQRAGRSGHGLIGMTERAKALRGECTAGPRPDGGWLVEARLPWTE